VTNHINGKMRQLPSLDFREKCWTIIRKGWSRFRLRVEDMVENEDGVHEEGGNETTKEHAS